jgi:hypothetical protein
LESQRMLPKASWPNTVLAKPTTPERFGPCWC